MTRRIADAAEAYSPAKQANACWFSHKRTNAENISGSAVYDLREGRGTARAVQPGRSLAFDGVNGYVTRATGTPFTGFSAIFKIIVLTNNPVSGNGRFITLNDGRGTVYYTRFYSTNGWSCGKTGTTEGGIIFNFNGPDISINVPHEIAVSVAQSGANVVASIWLDGVLKSTSTTTNYAFTSGNTGIDFMRYATNYTAGNMYGITLWNTAKTLAEMRANSASGMYLKYEGSAASGTTAYDASGNGNHGTHSGGVTHATHTNGAGADNLNLQGYRLSGAVYIPLTVSSGYTLAADGSAADVTGEVPYNGTLLGSNCLTFNGTNQYTSTPLAVATAIGSIISVTGYFSCTGNSRTIISNKTTNGFSFYIDASGILTLSTTDGVHTANTITFGAASTYNTGSVFAFNLKFNGATGAYSATVGSNSYSGTGNLFNAVNQAINLGATGTPSSYINGKLFGFYIYSDIAQTTLVECYPISSGSGQTVYGVNSFYHGTAVNSPTWGTQDIFHWNLIKGFDVGRNKISMSNKFNISPWANVSSIILTANAIANPINGVVDAWKASPSSNASYILDSLLPGEIGTYTLSVYAKAGEQTRFNMHMYSVENGESRCVFNLSNGTVTSDVGSTCAIYSVGNGWYRCTLTKTFTGLTNDQIQPLRASTLETHNGINGFYVYGAQLEIGSSPTVYQPTTGSSNIGSKVPATLNGYVPNGGNDPVGKPSICGLNNGCETGFVRNPNGSPKLVGLGLTTVNTVYENTVLTYGTKAQNTDGSRNFSI